LAGFLL